MTVEEIKQTYSMRDILDRYGIQVNRSSFASCPFHTGDRTPSLKVYKSDFYCFACGAHGDIFTFVQKMDNLTFKEAFQLLGGNYEKSTVAARMKIYHAQKAREMEAKRRAAAWKKVKDNLEAIGRLREEIPKLEPFSDEWCEAQNEMLRQLALFDYMQEEDGLWSH